MNKGYDGFYDSEELSFGSDPTQEIREFVEREGATGRALDLGAGDGRNTLFLAEKGFEVTALDISKTGIDKLDRIAGEKGVNNKIETIIEDARDWVYPEGKFDLIVAVTLFDHLETPEIDKLFYKVRNSLKRGGIMFVKVHTIDDPGYRDDPEKSSELSTEVKHYFRPNELLKHFKGNFNIRYYEECMEDDTSHGTPHKHGYARILARKMK